MSQAFISIDRISNLDNESVNIVNDFLSSYKYTSHNNYIAAIVGIINVVKKDTLKNLDYSDYCKVKNHNNTNENITSQDRYREMFFKFLFTTDCLINDIEFEKIWIKDDLKKQLKNRNESKKQHRRNKPTLSFEEIGKIKEYINHDEFEDFIQLRMSFSIYMIFEMGCEIDELRKHFDVYSYDNGTFISGYDKEYVIPIRYRRIFEEASLRENNSFSNIQESIRRLGDQLGIDNLLPIKIKKARQDNRYTCSNCGDELFNSLNNWRVVEDRIICADCSEQLNTKHKVTVLEAIVGPSNAFEASSYFEEKKRELARKIDYLKLHELQIEIGNLAEAYVYEFERAKLFGTEFFDLVDKTKASNPLNGYDILSYDRRGNQLFIEVKGTSKEMEEDFFISSNELQTMTKIAQGPHKYLIYRVSNILDIDSNNIKLNIIDDIINSEEFDLEAVSWRVKCQLP